MEVQNVSHKLRTATASLALTLRLLDDEMFPKYTEWKSLETIVLNVTVSDATELLNLFLFRMPALKSLELGEIELQDNT